MGCFMLVAFSWIFFRANSISDGFQIVAKIFSWDSRATSGSREALFSVASLDQWMAVAAGILFLFLVELFQSRISFGNLILSRPAWQRWMIYYGFIFLILFFGQFQADVFIYEGF
jgi:hypothetical protein